MKYQNPLTDAQRTLVEENLGLISYAMNKVPVYLLDSREDAFQIGSIGLMKAARSYDPEKNVLFPTYAMTCITNELRMAIRHINVSNPSSRVFSCDAPITNADGESFSLIDMIPSADEQPDERYISRETLVRVLTFLKHMKDPDAYRIIGMIVNNRRQEEIAAVLGITQSAVSRKLRKIRSALQEAIQN